MSMKKRVYVTLFIMIITVLLLSYLVMYLLFDKTLIEKIEDYQNTVVTSNQDLISSFVRSMNQTTVLLVGDEALGKYLSEEITDTMTRIQVRSGIQKQFSHYLSLQNGSGNFSYRNTLFLNDELPVSDAFTAETLETTLPGRSSNVYSNQKVKHQSWYKKTLESSNHTYIFLDEATNGFCYAKKIQSNYYTGTYYPDGLCVVVIQIPSDKLEDILSVTPITPNSGFLLMQDDSSVLYQSSEDLPDNLLSSLPDRKESPNDQSAFNDTLTLDGKKYITYYKVIDNGLSLVFYTPFSDIREQVGQITNIYISFAIFFILLASLLSYLIAQKITSPINRFSKSIASIDDTRTFNPDTLKVSDDLEMKILRSSFGKLIAKTNALIDDILLQGEEKAKSELRLLQAQINPHFIYNAMDTVNWIALSKNEDEIANIVSSISNLMRYSITEPDKMVPLSLELLNIQNYIAIQQFRYENHIELTVETTLSPDRIFIPKFTVQPLVENSILHGNDDFSSGITIQIRVIQDGTTTMIEISDNGKGCDPRLLNRFLSYDDTELAVTNGFGIRNVNERIRLNFGCDSGLSYFQNKEHTLTALIKMNTKMTAPLIPESGK